MYGKDFKYMKRIFKGEIKITLRTMVIFLIVGTISLSITEEEIKKKAEEFRTEKYYYMGSGKESTLGIVDDYVNLSHSEFVNKDNLYIREEVPKDID